MDVTGYLQKVAIRINQESLIPSLIQMTCPHMSPIERSSIADVEMAHEFGKVPLGRTE
jgi:hypothetical protein